MSQAVATVLDLVPHPIWRAHSDGTMFFFNQTWSTYTGMTIESSVPCAWQAAYLKDELELLLVNWESARRTAEKFMMNCRVRDSLGNLRWHSLSVLPEFDSSGDVLSWVGTSVDINDKKNSEMQMIKAQIDAVSANQAKANFLANMSHEIRTPLNAVLGFTDLIMISSRHDDETISHLATVRRNGNQLLKIIDEILDVSKVESGKLEFATKKFDVAALYQELHGYFKSRAGDRNLDFGFNYSTPVPRYVISDAGRYRQILENVIGNAIKFTTLGRVDVAVSWVKYPGEEAGSQALLRCSVKDTGVGIELAHSDLLFKPFSQLDGSMTRQFGGAGLGLALSRRLALGLGGNVYIRESQLSVGSEFIVEIAVGVVAESEFDQSFIPHVEEEQRESQCGRNLTLRGTDVLVVDDAVDNRILMGHFLTSAGAKADFASNGHEGVAKALANKYHLILMDIQMPGLDGYEATSLLRRKGFTRPIIALTAHAFKEERDRSLAAGCNDHLTKPIDRKLLISQIAMHVSRSEDLGLTRVQSVI
jgi:PAS domain S-box-containing protein